MSRTLTGRTLSTVGVLGVSVVTGVLFGISASSASHQESVLGLDLPMLVADKQEAVAAAEQVNSELKAEVEFLAGDVEELPGDSGDLPFAAQYFAAQYVVGPGVIVELTDAPADLIVEANPNDLVVHQEDVNAVMNALWRGGAEAMAVQGLRVTPNTPVRCIGNVILVGSSVFSPPYRIEAIGDPGALQESVKTDPQVEIYQQYVRTFGIGWRMEARTELILPPLSEGLSFKHAHAIE